MTACLPPLTHRGQQFATLVDLLRHRRQQQPQHTAYIFLQNGETETDQWTYQQLDQKSREIAALLQSLNAAGERALLLYQPGLEYIAAFMGCLYAGVIAVPAYPPRRNQNASRLQAIVKDADATIALTTAALLTTIEPRFSQNAELAGMQWLATDNPFTHDFAEDWQPPEIDSHTLAFLQYTSGSTGKPKGVMVTHGNLLHNLSLIYQNFEHTPHSQGVIWLPPYHDMGLIGGILQPLYGGFPVALMPPVAFLQKPVRWLQAISRYQATTSGGPNFAYDLVCRKITPEQLETLDLSHWDLAFTGAEPIRVETLDRFAATFEPCGFRREAFYPCYGMAETTLIVSGGLKTHPPIVEQIEATALTQHQVKQTTDTADSLKFVSCGYSLSDLNILIVDPDSRIRCDDNQVGEIWVSGPSITQGYWQKPEKTRQIFQAYLASGEGPFLRTEDLGFLQNGELFVTGRLKDMMIIRGQNHYPQDIELTVEQSHPALRPACGAAFSIEVKGEERLVIVSEVERTYLRKLNVPEVIGNIRQAIATQHNLQVYAAVLVKTGSIPKTSSGKIQRYACRAGFLTGNLQVVEDWSENPRNKAKFLNLQDDVDSLLKKLTVSKAIGDRQ
jgi:acyl-CoA synthetase (AMP-forming)/AMP-acid ligase II